jgi:putative endonuclease
MSWQKGTLAETLACEFLTKKGLICLARNYRCKTGEIDLIMQDQDIFVFVEVRYRQPSSFASAIESISPQKQQKLIRTAYFYLQQKKLFDQAFRFDTVTLSNLKSPDFDWIPNAFSAAIW